MQSGASMNLPSFLQTEPDTGFIRLTGHRIGLADIVRLYSRGSSAEIIASHFPTLSLSLVYSVLAFYLDHQAEVDAYVSDDDAQLRRLESESATSGPAPALGELQRRFNAIRPSGS